jgi:transposase
MVVRTYAPRGQTPVLEEYLSRDHLSVIGAVTPEGKSVLKIYDHPISSVEVIEFLNLLQRYFSGLLTVIWDGSPTHRSKAMHEYLSNGAAKRIHLERLPGYAPELNPTEYVWSYLKKVDLANLSCNTLPEIRIFLNSAKRRLRRKPELLKSFIQHVGYQV